MRLRTVIAMAAALAVAPIAVAGETEADSPDHAAVMHLKNQEWAEAVDAYKALVKADPDNGLLWFRLGYAHHGTQDYKKAIKAYQKAVEKGFYAAMPEYNTACAYALLGETNEAFFHLEKAMNAGFGDTKQLTEDPDLVSLREDPRWERTLTRADKVGHPCGHDEHMAAFDGWLGTWKVTDAAGTYVGKNTITKRNNDCVVLEEWQSVNKVNGISMNFYDPGQQQWIQLWRGDRGTIGRYAGDLDEQGRMVLTGTNTAPDGTVTHSRGIWTFNEDGTVTQEFFESEDGETWDSNWAGTYTRIQEMEDAASSAD